ncbi:MAG: formylglycine-generating enzyme family protein [Anaerolineales bacterium]
MKKVFPVLMVLVLFLSACGAGSEAQPTAIPLATAAPTAVPVAVPTERPLQNAQLGDERASSVDGMAQVFIPAGSFQMGGLDQDAKANEKPARPVSISAFWMDKLEVTNAMYSLCVQAGVCQLPRDLGSATRPSYFANAEFADYPVIFVSWEDAKTYCNWAGRRLPTEAEWEYAARGSDFRRYPWGDQSPTNNLANYDYGVRDTMRVGSYPSGASPFGVLDMAGNVWEWVADFYNESYYEGGPSQDPRGPATASVHGLRRSIRGGSWADAYKEVRVSNRGFSLSPDLTADSKSEKYKGEANNRIGFRCAADN